MQAPDSIHRNLLKKPKSFLLSPTQPMLWAMPEDMEFDTMSGFVVDLLGYIPEARENPSVQWENIRFTVLNMEENWISRIKAEILPEQTAEEQPETK